MPLYDYQCSKCQHVVEVRHGFNDTYAEACPACGGELKRIISPAPVIFKGSGFYVTDSRKPSGEKPSSDTASASKESSSKESSSKESSSKASPSKESAA